MIAVRFLGGAKKSFLADDMNLNESDVSIEQLLEVLLSLKPQNTPDLDVDNILIAINGVDSSAMDGKMTIIKNNDVVSIIPIIHGGESQRCLFTISKKCVQIVEISGKEDLNSSFIDTLRKKLPRLLIQAVSSNFVLSPSHVQKIISLSFHSQKNNSLISNKLETDILMRFALTSQISTAIATTGIKSKKNFMLIAIGNQKQLDTLYSELLPYLVIPFSKDNATFLKKQFGINKKQIDSTFSKNPLEDLLVEKAAILF